MKDQTVQKQQAAFHKMNYLIMFTGYLLVLAGFLLMTGSGSTDTYFEPDIFSVRRIGVAPVVCLTGFIVLLLGIIYRPRN